MARIAMLLTKEEKDYRHSFIGLGENQGNVDAMRVTRKGFPEYRVNRSYWPTMN